MTAPRPHHQVGTLVRTFVSRFFDNDVTGDARDVKTMFFAVLAVLAVPGALVPFLLANPTQTQPGWDLLALEQGVEVLRAISRSDKVFYLGFAMIAAGFVSALTWNALIVDRKDGLILGGLPIRARTIVLAKLVALAGFVSGVAVAMHTAASISFGSFLASHNTVAFALRGIAAHFVASCAASAFVLLTAAAVQGLALTVLGPRVFRRASPALQTALVAAVLATMIMLPDISGAVVATLAGAAAGGPWILSTPPLWFLGVYESVLGTTDATLIGLAGTAVMAVGIPLVVVAVTYPLAYRRLMRTVVEQPETVACFRTSSMLIGAVARVIGRAPEIRAVTQFYLSALVREDRQRLVLATAVGCALVWGVPAWMAHASQGGMLQIDLLSWALVAPLFVVAGLRMAAALPANTAGAWVFDVLPPSATHVQAALERTILFVGIVPVITPFALVIWRWWGGEAAAIHAAFSLGTAFLFLQCLGLFWRFDRVPCTRPWDVGAMNLRLWWPVYALLFVVLTRGLPGVGGLPDLDLTLIHSPVAAACVVAVMVVLALRVRRAAVSRQRVPTDEPAGVLASAMRARRLSRQVDAETHRAPGGARQGTAASSLELLDRHRWPAVRVSWRDVAAATLVPGSVFRRDVVLALRRLRRSPVFTAFSVLTLGGGIAATTLAFAVVHALVWTRPPIAEFDQLVQVSGERFAGQRSPDRGVFSWLDFRDLREQQTTFASLAASTFHQVSFVGGQASAVVNAGAVNGEFFRTLGLRAAVGRLIEPADDRRDAEPVVVLSYNTRIRGR